MLSKIEDFTRDYDVFLGQENLTSRHRKMVERIKRDLKPCEVVSAHEVFQPEQIELIKQIIKPKECFRNAYKIAEIFGANYIEGKCMLFDIMPIDHAWNKVGDKYIDVTFELAIDSDVAEEKYAALLEMNYQDVSRIILKRRYFGDIYRELIEKEIING